MVSRLDFFENAEAILERNLVKNPYYPFQLLCHDDSGYCVFVYSKRLPYFYFALCGCVGSTLGLAIWLLAGADPSYTLFGVLVFMVSCYLCVEYHDVHSIVLEPGNCQYSIYVGRTLITTKLLHNIYVRMQQERTGFRQTKFFLVVNGLGFESPIVISNLTVNRTKLTLLGRRVAKQLNLNYFDLNDTSLLHCVKHFRPSHKEGTEKRLFGHICRAEKSVSAFSQERSISAFSQSVSQTEISVSRAATPVDMTASRIIISPAESAISQIDSVGQDKKTQ